MQLSFESVGSISNFYLHGFFLFCFFVLTSFIFFHYLELPTILIYAGQASVVLSVHGQFSSVKEGAFQSYMLYT